MGGYTLLEVMIFLAISTVLFAISGVVLQGQGAHTEFQASMNEVNSKMQTWIDQVKNGYTSNAVTGGTGNYNCSLDASNSPVLTAPSSGPSSSLGANLSCIFLGKAIMVNGEVGPGPHNANSAIYAYTVLGRRTYDDGTGQSNVTTLQNANPTAAVFNTTGGVEPDIQLTESYRIPNGVKVLHAQFKSNPAGSANGLAGFFIDPTSASSSVLAVQYPLNTNIDPTDWGGSAWDIPNCIDLRLNVCKVVSGGGGTPANLWPMNEWDICFESSHNDERALISVLSSNGIGAETKLQMGTGSLCN